MLQSLFSRYRFTKNFLIYSGGAILARGLSFLSIPIWVAYFSPKDFGTLDLLYTIRQGLVLIIGFNLINVLTLDFFILSSTEKIRQIRETIFIYSVLLLGASFIFIPTLSFLRSTFFHNTIPIRTLFLNFLIIPLTLLKLLMYRIVTLEEKASEFISLQLIESISLIVGNGIFIFIFKKHITGVLYAQCISSFLPILIFFKNHTKNHPFLFFPAIPSWKKIKQLLTRGLSFFPLVAGSYLFFSSDKLALSQFVSLHNLGLYAFATKFGALFEGLILAPLANAYQPYIRKKYLDNLHDAQKESFQHLRFYLGLFCSLTFFGYFITKPLILFLIPRKFHNALSYIFFILLSQIAIYGTIFTSGIIMHTQKIQSLSVLFIAAGLLNICLNITLTPTYGTVGCLASTVISSSFYCLAGVLINKYLFYQNTQHYLPAKKQFLYHPSKKHISTRNKTTF